MTEQPAGTQDQGESFVASEGQAEAQEPAESGHPAWQEILGSVPEAFHGQVRPTLEKWDKGVQEQLEKARGEWREYQFIRDAGIQPQTVQYALNIIQAMQNDPRAFYDSLGEYYKFNQAQQALAEEASIEPEDPYAAQLQEMQKNMETMARALYAQQQKEKEAQEDAALEQELASLRSKYGEYDEQYVLGLMANGQDGESAVRQFKALESRLRGGNGQATASVPKVMGSGGGAPTSGAVDPRKLDAKGRKDLVAQMLEAANRQGA